MQRDPHNNRPYTEQESVWADSEPKAGGSAAAFRTGPDQFWESLRSERRYRALLEFLPDPVVVFDMKETVFYLNPAFVRVFGWTLDELQGRRIPYIPENLEEQSRREMERLRTDKMITGFETRRCTRDGRVLDIVLNASMYYEERNAPAGMIVLLRDATLEKRAAREKESLYRIATAIPKFRELDGLLRFIIREVRQLVHIGGASVILLDEARQEFYFRAADFDSPDVENRFGRLRFPAAHGVAGEVYKTGKPLIVRDTEDNPHFFKEVDARTGYQTKNMLDVPIRTPDRMIGVLCAVNREGGEFGPEDETLLGTIAGMVALPIENARINEELRRSYEEVQTLNRAKDRVIHRLSHELKTPVSVLSASLRLLERRLPGNPGPQWKRILSRARRNVLRLLEMQYGIEDILREKDYGTYRMLSRLLDAGSDGTGTFSGPTKPRTGELFPSLSESGVPAAALGRTAWIRKPLEPAEPQPAGDFFREIGIEFLIHELKDPLAVLEAGIRSLLERKEKYGDLTQKQQRTLQRMLRSSKKAGDLLTHLLEIGRAEAGVCHCRSFRPGPSTAELLVGILEDTGLDFPECGFERDCSEFSKTLSKYGVLLSVSDEAKSTVMQQDETKFRQIVGNLLKNAMHHRKSRMEVRLFRENNRIVLEVADDGPGVPPEHHQIIFRRYTQITDGPTVSRKGHGLGLAGARILARTLGGDVAVVSRKGRGATFRMTLPVEFSSKTE